MFEFLKKKDEVFPLGLPTETAEQLKSDSPGPLNEPTQESESKPVKVPPPEIPENIFVEYKRPIVMNTNEVDNAPTPVNDLSTLYRFLERNLEKKGYEDALINPDTSFMEEHIKYVNNELDLVISKVKSYYGNHLRDVNFHIETRKRNGMIETVEELITHRSTIDADMEQVTVIEEDSRRGTGLSQNLFLSYRRGFKNGFAAITYNTILGKRG